MAPNVSIILPLYRVWDFLPEAIASVKAQTFTDFECLCLDDGSPNDMVAQAKALIAGDPRFRVEVFPNGGTPTTRNRGLDLASGDFITFLDQDDYYHPRFLERMLGALEAHQADCVVCDFQFVMDDTHPTWEVPEKDSGALVTNPLRWALECRKDIYNVWQKVYRRSAIQGMRFDPELKGSDDSFFTFESFTRPIRVVALQGHYYGYRRHSQSVSRTAPITYAFSKLALYRKLASIIPPNEKRPFRKHVLQKISSVIKDYAAKPYTPEEHQALVRAIEETMKVCHVSPWGWSLSKHLRYRRYRRAHT